MSDEAATSAVVVADPVPLPSAEVVPLRKRGAPTGRPKPEGSGRKKGTPNKRNAEAAALLAALKCDPLTGMARIAMNKKNPPELRAKMFAELAQYVHPKKRAVEVTSEEGEPFVFVFQNAVAATVVNSPDAPNL